MTLSLQFQVIIITIEGKGIDTDALSNMGETLREHCKKAGIRAKLHDHAKLPGRKPGFWYNYYESRGVPVRVEIGQRDLEKVACVPSILKNSKQKIVNTKLQILDTK